MFERLPIEVLNLIATNLVDGDFKTLFNSRLVCRLLNAVAEPAVFASLSLEGAHMGELEYPVQRLQTLAAGATPYTRWAHTLLIEQGSLYPSLKGSNSSEERVQKALQDCQDVLVPAIISLSNLKCARFRMERRDPYDGVLHALSVLPKLTELSLAFGWDLETAPASLAQFTNLQVLHLAGWRLFPSFLDAIRGMLARGSNRLEEVILLPYVWPTTRQQWLTEGSTVGELRCVPLQRIAGDAIFPLLKKLVVDASGIKLSGGCGTTFRTLTHLEILFGTQDNVGSGFWQSLENAGVCLEALSVFPMTKSVSNYLTSYSGLRILRLCHAPGHVAPPPPDEDLDAMAHKLFHVTLPKHRHTLRHLAFEGVKFDVFALDDQKLGMVLGCTELEKLWIVYNPFGVRPYDAAHPGLVRTISRLVSNLPRLHELTMQSLGRGYHRPIPPGSISMSVAPPGRPPRPNEASNRVPLKDAMRKGFWESVRRVEEELKVTLFKDPGEAAHVSGEVPRQFEVGRSVGVEWRPY